MLIVKIYAGLANQMFQYALYKSLLSSNKTALTDTNSFLPKWEFEKVSLEDIFPNVKINNAEPYLIEKIADNKKDILNKLKRKLNFYKSSFYKEPKYSYNPAVFDLDGDYYLQGFWQTEKYFKKIEDEIRNDFQFPPFENPENIRISEILKSEDSVSVHIRKGADYQKKSTVGTCNINYYKKAVDYMRMNIKNPKFYIFSDNHQWVKNNLTDFDYTVIDWNPSSGPQNYLDMQLMATCRHNIIANSSYSWWGAWLNNNDDKIVIGPDKWFTLDGPDYDSSTILPDNWVKI